jgi:prepilin-type N-terminal cleavage/methylation domain-containing protein
MANRRTISIRRGFTLLELVLVMLIIAIALGSVAPTMDLFAEGRKVNETAEHFITTARWARQQAMSEAATYQINLDAANRSWQTVIVSGGQQGEVAGEFGARYTADAQVDFSAVGLGGAPISRLVFEPNGRVDISQVKFTGQRGKTLLVICDSSLGEFRLAEGER